MTNQEYEIRAIYQAIKAVLCHTSVRLIGHQRADLIEFIVRKTAEDIKQARENKCNCADHFTSGRLYWMKQPRIYQGTSIGTAYPVEFKYCPECGRPLLPNEKIGK
jgi:hypothetical protein